MKIHPTAIVDTRAAIDSDVEIGAYAVVDGAVRIRGGACLRSHAVVTGWTEIGARCVIHPHACIGGAPQDRAFSGARSYCRIGEDTQVREGVTVHRGTTPDSTTTVGARCLLMVNSHIGHNCQIGDDVVLVNGTVLGGYVSVGPRAFLSGLSGIHQFVRIGELAMVGGVVKIVMDVPPFMTVGGCGDACTGINVVGLRRANVPTAERDELCRAFRVLYRSGHLFRAACDELAQQVVTNSGRALVQFLREPSKRGILPGRVRTNRTPHIETSASDRWAD